MINVIDMLIIIVILSGAYIGSVRGFFKQSVKTIGLVIALILAFILKNPISTFMYKTLPFFGFDMILKNASTLNILVYEVIAFLITFSILEAFLSLLIKMSSIIERILKISFILEIPSKVLGALLGAFENYLLIFILLFVLSLPVFDMANSDTFKNSKLKEFIMNDTIIISDLTESTTDTFTAISDLIIDSKKNKNHDFNCKAMEIMIDKDFIKEKNAKYLYDSGKINTKCGLGD